MAGRLHDQVAVITGASRGIGRAMAQAYAAEGARLCLLATRADTLAAVAQALALPPERLMTLAVDVRDRAACLMCSSTTPGCTAPSPFWPTATRTFRTCSM